LGPIGAFRDASIGLCFLGTRSLRRRFEKPCASSPSRAVARLEGAEKAMAFASGKDKKSDWQGMADKYKFV